MPATTDAGRYGAALQGCRRALCLATLAALGQTACSDRPNEELELGRAQQARAKSVSFRNDAAPSAAYAGSADTTLQEAFPTSNFGGAETCAASSDDGAGNDTSCLLRWNTTGIPAGATVHSASISLEVVDESIDSYDVFELGRGFHESRATWAQADAVEPWGAPGAVAGPDRGAFIGAVAGTLGQQSIDLDEAGIALVQRWVDGAPNHGLLIASATSADGIAFASSEASVVDQRPTLHVTYSAIAQSGTALASSDTGAGAISRGLPTAENLLVAFIGDQGNTEDASVVLRLIAAEGADAVVHNGDFDYQDNPAAWENRINGILGPDYPYFAVVGNHDAYAWNGPDGYGARIAARQARVPEMECTGEPGVKASCYFRGLHLIESCVGTHQLRADCGPDSSEHVEFIRDTLRAEDAIFSVCNWHKNQHDMQVGTKSDEVGWSAYQVCMDAGAMIATGHEHSYSRTYALTDVGNAAAGHGATGASDIIELEPGSTFAFVSGIAGAGVRNFSAVHHDDDTWWASYYTADRWLKNGTNIGTLGNHGALFIRFHVDGNPRRARAYFKDVTGRMVDEFEIEVR